MIILNMILFGRPKVKNITTILDNLACNLFRIWTLDFVEIEFTNSLIGTNQKETEI